MTPCAAGINLNAGMDETLWWRRKRKAVAAIRTPNRFRRARREGGLVVCAGYFAMSAIGTKRT